MVCLAAAAVLAAEDRILAASLERLLDRHSLPYLVVDVLGGLLLREGLAGVIGCRSFPDEGEGWQAEVALRSSFELEWEVGRRCSCNLVVVEACVLLLECR